MSGCIVVQSRNISINLNLKEIITYVFARNKLVGVVSSIVKGAVNNEVVLTLDHGNC